MAATRVSLKTAEASALRTPALGVFLFAEDQPGLDGRPELSGLAPLIRPRLESGDFKAKHLETMVLFPESNRGPERVVLVGLGPEAEYGVDRLRPAAAKAIRVVGDLSLDRAALVPPPARPGLEDPADVAETTVLGALLGAYRYSELKTRDKPKAFGRLTLVQAPGGRPGRLRAALDGAEATAEALRLTRDLANRPANLLYPEAMAEEARRLAGRAGLKIKVLDMNAARRKGMGAFLAVAGGSARPGRIIVMEYRGAAPSEKPVALVGKAITFDSGGLNLKPVDGMGNMKTDMAGGAAVMAVILAAARLRLKINLVGVVPAAENMPGGAAYRPGDVLTTMSGQTVEVFNTDAEGRLVLADGMALAREYKPRVMIDLATLTGACAVALGNRIAGLFGNEPGLVEALREAGRASGETAWPMPLFEPYFEMLKSEVADFQSAGSRYGGAISAALFLKQFVGQTPWAHIDIAGPSRADKASPDTPAGATGFGAGLLLRYLRDLAAGGKRA